MPVPLRRALSAAALTALLLPLGCSTPLTTRREEEKLMSSNDDVARPAPRWGIVIHGGAGVITREALTAEREAAVRAVNGDVGRQRGVSLSSLPLVASVSR